VNVRFRKGANRILVKVDNDWGEYGFCLRALCTASEKLDYLYRDKLVLMQDRFVVTAAQERVTFRAAVLDAASNTAYAASLTNVIVTRPTSRRSRCRARTR